jgi:hypothetical protein
VRPETSNLVARCISRNGSISRSVVSAVTQPDHLQKMRAGPNGGYAARLVVRREPLTGQKQSSPVIPAPELLRGVVLRAVGRNALRPTYKRYHLASRSAMPPSWGWCFPQTSPVSWLNARRQSPQRAAWRKSRASAVMLSVPMPGIDPRGP